MVRPPRPSAAPSSTIGATRRSSRPRPIGYSSSIKRICSSSSSSGDCRTRRSSLSLASARSSVDSRGTDMTERTIERRELLRTCGTGAAMLALVAADGLAGAAELSESEAANVKLVTAFCAAWSSRNLANVTALMSDDAVYRMSQTTPPVTGHAGLVGQMQPWVDTSDTIEFKILETMAKGPIVINHRIDRFAAKKRPGDLEGA